MAQYWGFHLLLNCSTCNDNVKSKNAIIAFTKDLVEAIDMKAYGEPIVEHFAAHDPSKGGYSLVQLIETSNITGHFVDSNNDCYLDIFSCKDFSVEKTLEIVNKHFAPKHIEHQKILRKAL